jgi:hypothetical protein
MPNAREIASGNSRRARNEVDFMKAPVQQNMLFAEYRQTECGRLEDIPLRVAWPRASVGYERMPSPQMRRNVFGLRNLAAAALRLSGVRSDKPPGKLPYSCMRSV